MSERPARACGECSLCCVVLRVDELEKLGGAPCRHLGPGGAGCTVYEGRPDVCRRYRCLWLRGWLEEGDRPDRLGAVLDLDPGGVQPRLAIREAAPGAFERSERLREIAERFRETLPVRITDADDVMDPDRPFRVLLAGGVEQRVAGERIAVYRDGVRVAERRLPWLERGVRRLFLRLRRLQLRLRYGERAAPSARS